MALATQVPSGERYGVEITLIPASEVSVQWDEGEPYAVLSTRMILRPKDAFPPDMTENEKENSLRQVAAVIVAEIRKAGAR